MLPRKTGFGDDLLPAKSPNPFATGVPTGPTFVEISLSPPALGASVLISLLAETGVYSVACGGEGPVNGPDVGVLATGSRCAGAGEGAGPVVPAPGVPGALADGLLATCMEPCACESWNLPPSANTPAFPFG